MWGLFAHLLPWSLWAMWERDGMASRRQGFILPTLYHKDGTLVMTAQTTVKMSPEGHQALVALLKYLSGKTDGEMLKAVLQSQGRPSVPYNSIEKMVAFAAESVLLEVN